MVPLGLAALDFLLVYPLQFRQSKNNLLGFIEGKQSLRAVAHNVGTSTQNGMP